MRLYKLLVLFIILGFSRVAFSSPAEFEPKRAGLFSKVFLASQQSLEDYFSSQISDEQALKLIRLLIAQKKWQAAAYLIQPLARKGNMAAQSQLGIMYLYGEGVPQNDELAFWWLNEAADKGSIKGINNLAQFYVNGRLVKKSIPHAIKLLEKTANSDSVLAMTFLGWIYQNQLNEPQNALKWYEKASEKGDLQGRFLLAELYEQGYGAGKTQQENRNKAIDLYRQLAQQKGEYANRARVKLEKLMQ